MPGQNQMVAAKKKQRKNPLHDRVLSGGSDARTVKVRAFWSGVREGFSGPLLLGCRAEPMTPFVVAILEDLKEGESSQFGRELSSAIERATRHVMEKHGLVSVVERKKRLDDLGKMQDVDVRVVEQRRHAHGKPQE